MFEDNRKNRHLLEEGLKKFWADYGGGASLQVKSPNLNLTIDPAMITGNTINPIVSEKLEEVYYQQNPKK